MASSFQLDNSSVNGTENLVGKTKLQKGINSKVYLLNLVLGYRLIQDFPKALVLGKFSSLSKIKSLLGWASNGLGLGSWGSCSFGSWETNSFPYKIKMISALSMTCVLFGQHCLIGFKLILSHCMRVFFWVCFISALKTLYKMLWFLISLLGIRWSLWKAFWDQLLYLLFPIPWYFPLGSCHWKMTCFSRSVQVWCRFATGTLRHRILVDLGELLACTIT